jgi:hypothetical protein
MSTKNKRDNNNNRKQINKRMRENKRKTHNIVYLVQSNNDPSLKERAALGSSS